MLPEIERDAAQRLRESRDMSGAIEDELRTNDRVVARVTDGIYRQPGSALRELIANAYDADATWVNVTTDAPKFNRITVEDNGQGMSPEVVVHLLRNIGGSVKRTQDGKDLGVTRSDDPTESPMGRPLIGKLGIGIFSVSQLTHNFQIITKTKGDSFRTIALVKLRQFADEPTSGDETDFKAGQYRVWREPTRDTDTHGTTVVLNSIRPQTRATLQSEQIWSAAERAIDDDVSAQTTVPQYYIGRLLKDDVNYLNETDRHPDRSLPWTEDDSPALSFKKMVDAVWTYVRVNPQNAKLANIFDTYLQMVWDLALALPLPYVEKSLFEESIADDWAYFYRLSNSPRGSAEAITTDAAGSISIGQATGTSDVPVGTPFRVLIDGVELRRPIRYRNLPVTTHALKKPMVFVGSLQEDFAGYNRDVSAGPLSFKAYLFWTPKVAPTEHQGVLVRIHGASGTLFDPTFLNYQVSEQTRLRQVTCEVFVDEGLEAALNIDRESFNTSHPHTVVLTKWIHSALRQLASAQKREAQVVRKRGRVAVEAGIEKELDRIIDNANEVRTGGEGLVPDVVFSNVGVELDFDPPTTAVRQTFTLAELVAEATSGGNLNPKPMTLRKLKAITQVLSVYGALDQLSEREQTNLIGSILGILEAEDL